MGRKAGKTKKDKQKLPSVHPELAGFNITVNEFGEISSNFEVERLNKFLDENLSDKKLKNKPEADDENQKKSDDKPEIV